MNHDQLSTREREIILFPLFSNTYYFIMSFFNRLFKFRIFKFRSTLSEELEDLHTESLNLQQSLIHTRLLQRKWTKLFAIYALVAYLILNIVYFTFFLSNDNIIRIYAAGISLTVGALLYGLYRLICWYFRTIIQMKEDRLALFKDRKQELIEEVKNKETYAVAKTILEKYGETITADFQLPPQPTESINRDLRQRVTVRPTVPGSDKPVVSVAPPNIGRLENFTPQVSEQQGPNNVPVKNIPGRLPRAILPPERTFWGSILDFIVGDGPSKRYALICKNCNSHNGMALEEEFEYLTFRCAYCNYLNSAHKQKPVFLDNTIAQPATTSQPENESTVERMVSSSSESSITNEDNDTGLNPTHRSVRIPDPDDDIDASRSRSPSAENRQEQQPTPLPSEEN
ncbi:unnamed protein product [Rotaria socialis]|uniref:Endoplasmic reticulum junction formation protein lunapark n=2 Tax=Rotaria socialis TaxID=392032 RepID=A0A818UJN0_9BILA|nr:unnamed protein product [Rotaria socialis]